MSDLNKEIEEASVGSMMPIVTPDETLSKATPESIDGEFATLKIGPTPEDPEPEDDFDESVSDLAAIARAFKARKKVTRDMGGHNEEIKAFNAIIGKVEKYLKGKDDTFVPFSSLKKEIKAVSEEDRKEMGASDKNMKISVVKFNNGDKTYARLTIIQHPDKEKGSLEVSLENIDVPAKYWNYYHDCVNVKYLHIAPSYMNDWKKLAGKIDSGKDVTVESAFDTLVDNGIDSVLYEHFKETEGSEDVVVFESVFGKKNENFNESFDEEEFTEAAKIDDDIKDIIKTLNDKGYETKYSCSGHPSARLKSDGKRDGIKDKKLYSTARVVFSKAYDLPSIPEGWEEKMFDDGTTGIYVKGPTFKIINGLPTDQFYKWKQKYMDHLRKWAEDLPEATAAKKVNDSDMTESMNEVFQDLLIDLS